MRFRHNRQEPNFWPAYADCMLALFMIALLLWILSAGKTIFMDQDSGAVIANYEKELRKLNAKIDALNTKNLDLIAKLKLYEDNNQSLADTLKEIRELEKEIADLKLKNGMLLTKKEAKKLTDKIDVLDMKVASLQKVNGDLRKKIKELNDKPPIIELAEAQQFVFPAGGAALNPQFKNKLFNEIFPKLEATLLQFPRVDTIEIIGHTDGTPVRGRANLAALLPAVILNNAPPKGLQAGSNADLGLMRALAIREAWKQWIGNRRLADTDVRCYSAAQTIPANGAFGKNMLERRAAHQASRRIEIRVTDLKK